METRCMTCFMLYMRYALLTRDRLYADPGESNPDADSDAGADSERILYFHPDAEFGQLWQMAHDRHLICPSNAVVNPSVRQRADISAYSVSARRKAPTRAVLKIRLIDEENEVSTFLKGPHEVAHVLDGSGDPRIEGEV